MKFLPFYIKNRKEAFKNIFQNRETGKSGKKWALFFFMTFPAFGIIAVPFPPKDNPFDVV